MMRLTQLNPIICTGRSDDGETFVVKNTTKLANIEIPKYFDHKNFSSFSRQLNFYGFKKVPNKTIRIDQKDKSASGHVRFYNDKFKRGRTDLLNKIQRSTKNGGNTQNQAQAQEMRALKEKVSSLETQVSSMSFEMRTLQDQVRQLVDSSCSGMQQNVPQDNQNQASRMNPNAETYDYDNGNGYNGQSNNYATQQYTSSRASTETQWQNNPNPGVSDTAGPTLAPHPNTKQVDPNLLPPPPMDVSADRHATFLRGFSTGFDESLFEGPDGVTSSTVDLNQGNMIDQGNMMARIQSLDISGVYNHKANTSVELPPVDNERNIESQVGV